MFDRVEFRYAVCDHYTAAEIVEALDLTSEEIFDILSDTIYDHTELFELVAQDFFDEEDEEEEPF